MKPVPDPSVTPQHAAPGCTKLAKTNWMDFSSAKHTQANRRTRDRWQANFAAYSYLTGIITLQPIVGTSNESGPSPSDSSPMLVFISKFISSSNHNSSKQLLYGTTQPGAFGAEGCNMTNSHNHNLMLAFIPRKSCWCLSGALTIP